MTQLFRSATALLTAGLLSALPVSATANMPSTGGTTDRAPATAEGSAQVQDARLLLLMDSSWSMAEDDATGTPKIDAAKTALTEVIDGLDPDQQVGLRVFGGDVARDQPTEAKCTDSRLVVPIGPGNTTDLNAAVTDYEPTGETPIGHALQQAADDLGTDGNRTILLVSDGIATCEPDPCQVAEQLTADGLDLVVHTVGLGADDATRSQLQCIADAAGGTYYDTTDTDTLTTALTRISTRAFRPFSVDGDPVEGSPSAAGAPVLAPGQYVDSLVGNDGAKHYLLRRSMPGSTLHVGLAAQSGPDQGAFVDLAISTPEGDECVTETAHTYEGKAVPLLWAGIRVTGTEVGAGGDDCAIAEELVLTVAPREYGEWLDRDLSGVPVELVVTEEPPVEPGALPERSHLPVWQEMAPAPARESVQGGASFNDAPLLQPGTSYDTDILNGEVLFFRVPATFGQQVQAQLDSEPMSGPLADYFGEHAKISAHVTVISPERADVNASLPSAEVEHDGLAQFGATEIDRAIASSGPILYLNRYAGGIDPKSATEGEYVIAVTADNPNLTASHAVPFTLTVDVIGEPTGAPRYVETPLGAVATSGGNPSGQTGGAAVEDPAVSTAPVAPTTGDDDRTGAAQDAEPAPTSRDGMPLAWVLGGAGVLAAAAGTALLITRGRARR